MQVGNDWNLVPAARNISVRHAALQSSYISCTMGAPKAKPLEATATDLVEAAEKLYEKLQRGTVKIHGRKRPIHGDLRLLRYADDLIPHRTDAPR